MTKEEMKNLLEKQKKLLEKELEKDINDSDKKAELDALEFAIWSIDKNYVDFAIRLNEYIIKNCDDPMVKLCWKNIKSDYLYLKGQQDFDKSKIISAPNQEYTEEFLQKIKDEDNIIYDTGSPFAIKIIPKGNDNSPWFQIMTEDDGNLFPSKIVFDIEWAEDLIEVLQKSIKHVKDNREKFGLKPTLQINKEFVDEYNEQLSKIKEKINNLNQQDLDIDSINKMISNLDIIPKLILINESWRYNNLAKFIRNRLNVIESYTISIPDESLEYLINDLCDKTEYFLAEVERGY